MNFKKFHRTIRDQRIRCNLSQEQVADKLNISRTTYCHYESGLRRPTIDSIFRLAAIFDINPMFLFIALFPEELENEFPEYSSKLDTRYGPACKDEQLLSQFYSLKKQEQNTVNKLIKTLCS